MNGAEFRVGDRVRLLPHDGRVGWVSDDKTHARVDFDRFFGGELLSIRNLELIVPALPNTPGTVLQDDAGFCWLLGNDKRWRCKTSREGLDSRYFLSAYADRLSVIFDAGAK